MTRPLYSTEVMLFRYRVAGPGLALSVVIDEDGTRLLPRGADAPRRQHGAQGPVLLRFVAQLVVAHGNACASVLASDTRCP